MSDKTRISEIDEYIFDDSLDFSSDVFNIAINMDSNADKNGDIGSHSLSRAFGLTLDEPVSYTHLTLPTTPYV